MPVTSTWIGVPTGPDSGVSFSDMAMLNDVWVSSRSPCCSTMSCSKPKSSGAAKLAENVPSGPAVTVAMR